MTLAACAPREDNVQRQTQEFLSVLPISWFDVEGDFHRPEAAIAKASAPAT
jgi:hypothetical protein